MIRYLIILDPSYAIMKTIDNTNRNIANTTSSLPSTPVR